MDKRDYSLDPKRSYQTDLTAEQKAERSRKAAEARWGKSDSKGSITHADHPPKPMNPQELAETFTNEPPPESATSSQPDAQEAPQPADAAEKRGRRAGCKEIIDEVNRLKSKFIPGYTPPALSFDYVIAMAQAAFAGKPMPDADPNPEGKFIRKQPPSS